MLSKYIYFLIFIFATTLLITCQNQSSQNQSNKDTITAKRAKMSVPEVEEIPGMRNGEQNRLEDVLPYYQSEELYYSLEEALANPDKVHRLRLRGMRLTNLPTEILKLENLKELDLSDNSLSRLPDSFAVKLKRLEILDLSNNQFSVLPNQITGMLNLGYLNLEGNQLNALPESISSLSSLQWLNIGRNRFNTVPTVLTTFQNLKNLTLDDIRIDSLPQQFENLKNIRYLSLRRTGLKSIPKRVFELSNLEELIIAENQIVELSPDLSKLNKLSYLNIEKNQLSSVTSITSLKDLVNLNLSHNPINSFPAKFFNMLSGLKALNLAYTEISELPSEISACQGLVWLSLQGNKVNELPNALSSCTRLRVVLLGDNPDINLETYLIPLKNLEKLHTLRLSHLPINAQKQVILPNALMYLKSLVELDLRENKLADVPAELTKLATLSNIQALNLSNSGIKVAHTEFKSFTNLKVLGLDLKNISFSEVQKMGEILPPDAEIVDGTQFFSYKYWLD
jgi:Leucine-rich repeat (LRR) protein